MHISASRRNSVLRWPAASPVLITASHRNMKFDPICASWIAAPNLCCSCNKACSTTCCLCMQVPTQSTLVVMWQHTLDLGRPCTGVLIACDHDAMETLYRSQAFPQFDCLPDLIGQIHPMSAAMAHKSMVHQGRWCTLSHHRGAPGLASQLSGPEMSDPLILMVTRLGVCVRGGGVLGGKGVSVFASWDPFLLLPACSSFILLALVPSACHSFLCLFCRPS